jgi:GLPGLI family protein
MLKTWMIVFLIFVGQIALSQTSSQKINLSEGKLVYDIEYHDSIFNQNPIKDPSFPKEIIYLIKGNHFRTEIQSDYTHATILGNLETHESDSYLEFLNKKLHVHFILDTLYQNAYSRNHFSYIFTGEQKNILGYPCQKVKVHFDNPFMKDIVLFYTESIINIPSPYTYAFLKLPGMILEIEENFQGIPLLIKVRTIQKMNLDSDYFLSPSGFTTTTIDDFFLKSLQP